MDGSSTSGRRRTRLPEAVHLEVRWKRKPVVKRGLKSLVRTVLAEEGRPGAGVGLLLTDDATLREMNRTWRGKDHATDVLAFPNEVEERGAAPNDRRGAAPNEVGEPDASDASYLGDISISMDRALEQAPRFSATFEQEVARLVIHGLLHLLGYDHHSPAEGRKMRAREGAHLARVTRGSIVGAGKR